MNITPHFGESELGLVGCEKRVRDNYHYLCLNLLEPIRTNYDSAVIVNSGFRKAEHNNAVGGKVNSYHLADGGRAAADINVSGIDPFILFEWLRTESNLEFDKVILEQKNGVPAVVHIQVDRCKVPERRAFIGSVGAASDYREIAVI